MRYKILKLTTLLFAASILWMNVSHADGPNDYCDADVNGDTVVNTSDKRLVVRAMGSEVGDPHYNENADLTSDGAVQLDDYQAWRHLYYTHPRISCETGGEIMGTDIHAAGGLLTLGGITVQVDPMAYTSGDSLDWTTTAMPYLPDGFAEHEAPLNLTSSVTTSLILSTTYTGPGLVMWPTLVAGAIDRVGDQGPWVAPQPSTSHEAGVWQFSSELEADVEKQIGPATAPYQETNTDEQVETPAGPQPLKIEWATPDGNPPPRRALLENAIVKYLESLQNDPTCPGIVGIVKLVTLPARVFTDEPAYIARYHNGVIYYSPDAFEQSDFDLELTTVHELNHLMQAALMSPWYDRWTLNPAILPLLSNVNVWTEAYATAAEISHFTTHFYDGWANTYAPWPGTFRGARFIGERVYNYHLGLPLSYMLDKGAAPTLCEFWGDPDLPLAILQETSNDIIQKNGQANFHWAEAVHWYNTDREEIAPGLTALIGAPSLPTLKQRDQRGLLPDGTHIGLIFDLSGLSDGDTVRLDWTPEAPPGDSLQAAITYEMAPRCEDHLAIHVSTADESGSQVGNVLFYHEDIWSSQFIGLLPEQRFHTFASLDGDLHFDKLYFTRQRFPDWGLQPAGGDPFPRECQ